MTGNPYAPEVERIRDAEPWQNRAACIGVDPEQFFTYTANHDTQARLMGEKYCDNCPVRQDCYNLSQQLNAADIRYGAYGIWAGLPPKVRIRNNPWACTHERNEANTRPGSHGGCRPCHVERERARRARLRLEAEAARRAAA
jgi:hypothetical protein